MWNFKLTAFWAHDKYGCLTNKKNSFIFNNCFILFRVMVEMEPVPGILGVRWKYNLDGILVHHHQNQNPDGTLNNPMYEKSSCSWPFIITFWHNGLWKRMCISCALFTQRISDFSFLYLSSIFFILTPIYISSLFFVCVSIPQCCICMNNRWCDMKWTDRHHTNISGEV